MMWIKGAFALKSILSCFVMIIFLTGCLNQNAFWSSKNGLLLAQQSPVNQFEQEAMIVQLSQILLVAPLDKDERAILHFERGTLYDSLGLWTLARYDFMHSLALQARMAPSYNYLGLYLLLEQDFEEALDAFNATLELDPNYEYAYLNRGLNFYYAKRYDLAQRDFERFFANDPSDPYRLLWLYFNELEINPQQAVVNLRKRANSLSSEYWGSQIVEYFLGEKSLTQLLQKIEEIDPQSLSYPEVLTETYFYLAKQKLNTDHIDEATSLFRLAVANQVYNFVEYRFALFELSLLPEDIRQGAVAQ